MCPDSLGYYKSKLSKLASIFFVAPITDSEEVFFGGLSSVVMVPPFFKNRPTVANILILSERERLGMLFKEANNSGWLSVIVTRIRIMQHFFRYSKNHKHLIKQD